MNDKQWNIFIEVVNAHNKVSINEAEQSHFDETLEKVLPEIGLNPYEHLEILIQRVELTPEWIEANPKFMTLLSQLINKFQPSVDHNVLSLVSSIRFSILEEYLKESKHD